MLLGPRKGLWGRLQEPGPALPGKWGFGGWESPLLSRRERGAAKGGDPETGSQALEGPMCVCTHMYICMCVHFVYVCVVRVHVNVCVQVRAGTSWFRAPSLHSAFLPAASAQWARVSWQP